jgi:hypothetical protein
VTCGVSLLEAGRRVLYSLQMRPWYSEDLRINLVLKHNDPRTGSVVLTVTQISRADPDSSLFQIPDGYTGPEAAR